VAGTSRLINPNSIIYYIYFISYPRIYYEERITKLNLMTLEKKKA